MERGERDGAALLPYTGGSIIKGKPPPVSHDRRGLLDLKLMDKKTFFAIDGDVYHKSDTNKCHLKSINCQNVPGF